MKSVPNKKYSRLIKTEGFSLIELLIVIFLVIVLAAILSALYFNTINTQKTVIAEASSLVDARTVLYIMEKEIREAVSFKSAEKNRISFQKKSDHGNGYSEIIYYAQLLDNKYILIKKQSDRNEETVLKNLISDNIFSYYYSADSLPVELPLNAVGLNNFKILKISFIMGEKLKENNKNLNLSTSIYLRNR